MFWKIISRLFEAAFIALAAFIVCVLLASAHVAGTPPLVLFALYVVMGLCLCGITSIVVLEIREG